MTGLKPREFVWVITGRLAVSERIGGYGIQHRRVRREEEILWLKEEAGITTIFSLLGGAQNLSSYLDSGFDVRGEPLTGEIEPPDVLRVYGALDDTLQDQDAVVLVHRDLVDDTVAGLLAGYLVYSKLVDDPILAAALIQEILKRPLGPEYPFPHATEGRRCLAPVVASAADQSRPLSPLRSVKVAEVVTTPWHRARTVSAKGRMGSTQ